MLSLRFAFVVVLSLAATFPLAAQSTLILPVLECVDAPPGLLTAVLASPIPAGIQPLPLPTSTSYPAVVSLRLNPGGANEESIAPSNSSYFTFAYAHNAGELVEIRPLQAWAFFGYFNPTNTPAQIIAGSSSNFFSPGNPDRGQPSQFPVGIARWAFGVPFSSNRDLIWVLGTQYQVARNIPELACSPANRPAWIERTPVYMQAGTTLPNSVLARVNATGATTSAGLSVQLIEAIGVNVSGLTLANSTVTASLTAPGDPGARVGYVGLKLVANSGGATVAQTYVPVFTDAPCAGALTPGVLPGAVLNSTYPPTTFAVTGTAGPLRTQVSSGGLPPGMALVNNALTGAPTVTGQFPFRLSALTASGCSAHSNYTLTVSGSGCAADVSDQVSITPGPLLPGFAPNRYLQTVTLRNTGTTAIAGPVAFVVEGLPPTAEWINPIGTTVCAAPAGRPYRFVNVGPDQALTPGETATVTLDFLDNFGRVPLTYTVRVLAGGTGL